jgi:hypothetical protein
VTTLDAFAALQCTEQLSSYHLASYKDVACIRSTFKVAYANGIYMLVWCDSGEEAILQVQGYIALLSLPPVDRQVRDLPSFLQAMTLPTRHAEHFWQSVGIVGPDSVHFRTACEFVSVAYRLLQDDAPYQKLSPLKMDAFNSDLPMLSPKTRLVTRLTPSAMEWASVPVPPSVESSTSSIRTAIHNQAYLFTEDHVVSYLKLDDTKLVTSIVACFRELTSFCSGGSVAVQPLLFRPGHLIEAGISFRVVPGQRGIFTFQMHLDSIMLTTSDTAMVRRFSFLCSMCLIFDRTSLMLPMQKYEHHMSRVRWLP